MESADEARAESLARRLGFPYASLANKILRMERSQNLDTLIPEAFARTNLVLPLFVEDGSLALAMVDPENANLLSEVTELTHLRVQPFVAAQGQLLEAIENSYVLRISPPAADGLAKPMTWEDPQVAVFCNAVLKQAIAEEAKEIHLELLEERASLSFVIKGKAEERMSPPVRLAPLVIKRFKAEAHLPVEKGDHFQSGAFSVIVQRVPVKIEVAVAQATVGERIILRINRR